MIGITVVACFACAALGVVLGMTIRDRSSSNDTKQITTTGPNKNNTVFIEIPRSRALDVQFDEQNVVETAVTILTDEVPIVGAVINFFIDSFWPHHETSVWNRIKDKVAALVEEAVVKAEVNERERDLDGLKETMDYYYRAENEERKGYLTSMVTECNRIAAQLENSPNRKHLIQLSGTFFLLHMGILAERYQNGHILFNTRNSEKQWGDDLEHVWLSFVTNAGKAVSEYEDWRRSKFKIEQREDLAGTRTICPACGDTAFISVYYAVAIDNLTNQRQEFSVSKPFYETGGADEVRELAEEQLRKWMKLEELKNFNLQMLMLGYKFSPDFIRFHKPFLG